MSIGATGFTTGAFCGGARLNIVSSAVLEGPRFDSPSTVRTRALLKSLVGVLDQTWVREYVEAAPKDLLSAVRGQG